jgi:formate dehydrogenase major subunit
MRHLYLELLLSDHNSFCTPPCRDACPTHIKIPQFLDYIAHKDYKNGVRKLREDLPFPAILGRVCPRPCEGPCRRQLVEQPITSASSTASWPTRRSTRSRRRAAAAGRAKADTGRRSLSWAAGLPACCRLLRPAEGHSSRSSRPRLPPAACSVTHPELPPPRDLLDKEINVCGAWVELQVSALVDYQIEDCEGRRPPRLAPSTATMGIPGETGTVVTAVDFLGELELNGEVHVGEKVTVIGGGFTAMDACRTSIRKGAREVTCLYRRSRKEMPAHHTEVDEAEEEGVRLELLVAPVRVLTDDANKVTASRCSA